MIHHLSFLFLSVLFFGSALAQNASEQEKHFNNLAKEVLKGQQDSLKINASQQLLTELYQFLADPIYASYPLDSLTYISKVGSPDKKVRLFTWYMILEDGQHEYFGILQDLRTKKKPRVHRLTDQSDSITDPSKKMLSASNWYGAIYYELIAPEKKRGNEFLLLGWDGHDATLNRKLIEPLSFGPGQSPRFGGNLRKEDKPVKRLLFEYGEMVSMTLQYNKEHKMIIFDHLAPAAPHLKDNPEYYGPDMSYDALFYEKGRWHYVKDIDARNPGSHKRHVVPVNPE